MGFLHLFIVNKSGGLILHRSFGPKAPKIGTNEWLRIGSTFHSLYAIAAEASPVKLPGNKNSCKFCYTTLYNDVNPPSVLKFFITVSFIKNRCLLSSIFVTTTNQKREQMMGSNKSKVEGLF
jgi:hypothetical protein